MSNNFSNIYPERPQPKTLSNSLFAALLWQNVSQKKLSTKIGMACYPFARARGAFKAIVLTRRLDRLFKGLNHSPRYRYAREGHKEPIAPPPIKDACTMEAAGAVASLALAISSNFLCFPIVLPLFLQLSPCSLL